MRGLQACPGRRIRKRGGRRISCARRRRIAKYFRRSDQTDLEPRRHDARHLPADFAAVSLLASMTMVLVGMHVRVSGQSINAYNNSSLAKDGKDDRQLQGYHRRRCAARTRSRTCCWNMRCATPMCRLSLARVNTNQNAAHGMSWTRPLAPGADPSSSPALMKNHRAPRCWTRRRRRVRQTLPAGVHRGVAQFMGYGSYSAAVAEVSVSNDGKAGPPDGAGVESGTRSSGPDRQVERLRSVRIERRVLRRAHRREWMHLRQF